jgi:hypothetical protein
MTICKTDSMADTFNAPLRSRQISGVKGNAWWTGAMRQFWSAVMIKARWVNGHAIPVEDVNWPEGSEVFLSRTPLLAEGAEQGLIQEENPTTVSQWLQWYDSLEPLVFEPGEEEAIEGLRRAIREKSSAGAANALEGLFE